MKIGLSSKGVKFKKEGENKIIRFIIDSLIQFFNNKIIIIAVITWIFNQTLKIILYYLTEKKWDIGRFFGAGGMPSTHSAISMCVAVSIGFKEGWDSSLFALALIVSMIVMADAAGVRRATGEQAKILNHIILEFFKEIKIRDERLKEWVGHTPFEVIVGALIGFIISILLSFYFHLN